ncbi:hypothetical protein GCM10010298_59620 [Streptomyces microflavus]|nr:hypothetical protein GCM10010298_59620 [Streptomyces microflavus]
METKAEAHSTTVVQAAAVARQDRAGAESAGVVVMATTVGPKRFAPHRIVGNRQSTAGKFQPVRRLRTEAVTLSPSGV